jgi:SnoaL-like protein
MSDPTAVVAGYIEMWNETDPRRRRQLVSQVVTDDASYVDPLMAGDGIDGISTMIGGAQEHYPGHRFALVSGPDSHHDCVRFSWSLTPDGGEPIAIGVDFATVTEDGRMRSITGFLEPAA